MFSSVHRLPHNAGHKWRADKMQISVKNTLVKRIRIISRPQDIARPSSCLCYAMGLFSDTASEVLTGIIRRSMSVQILRFIIRKSYSVCKFSQN